MYNIIRGGFEERHPTSFKLSSSGLSNYLVLIVHTPSQFHINGRFCELSPGQAIIIAPETPYCYGNSKGAYIDDWLHFSPDPAMGFPEIFPMTNELFPVGSTEIFTFLIKQILWEFSYAPKPYRKSNIDSLFTLLVISRVALSP